MRNGQWSAEIPQPLKEGTQKGTDVGGLKSGLGRWRKKVWQGRHASAASHAAGKYKKREKDRMGGHACWAS